MRLLILGGTQFVGRAMAESALERGHTVSLFHRGQTKPDLFAGDARVERIFGDRNTDTHLLANSDWDAAIDATAYFPHQVESAVRDLTDRIGFYAFVSTISVYANSPTPQAESSALLEMPDGADPTTIDAGKYGPLKSQCEEVVRNVFPESHLIVRAGLQIGKHDHTCRFSNWVERIGRQKRVIMPGGAPMTWQQIDARDTAEFTLQCIEERVSGTFNVTGYAQEMPAVLETIRSQINPACEFVGFSEEQIASLGLEPWKDIALWLPESEREGLPTHVSIAKALGAGLAFRPMSESIAEIWEAVRGLDPDRELRAGLSTKREQELLAMLSAP